MGKLRSTEELLEHFAKSFPENQDWKALGHCKPPACCPVERCNAMSWLQSTGFFAQEEPDPLLLAEFTCHRTHGHHMNERFLADLFVIH